MSTKRPTGTSNCEYYDLGRKYRNRFVRFIACY